MNGLPTRVEEKIDRSSSSTCWEWTAAKDPEGYGYVHFEGRSCKAHRVVYELLREPIPPGLVIDHLCRNPTCVNPAHMEAVTIRENTLRGVGPSAQRAARTECLNGHPFDEANTYINKRGHRECRACQTRRRREWIQRQKAKVRT